MRLRPPCPRELIPAGSMTFSLPGTTIQIEKRAAEFLPWPGPPLLNTLGPKKVLTSRGGPAFAELHISRMFEDAGWNTRWIEPWTRPAMNPAYLRGWNEADRDLCSLVGQESYPIEDPDAVRLLQRIAGRNGNTFAGCWDVFAWKDGFFAFVESKLRGSDQIQPSQVDWLAAALDAGREIGIDQSCFLVVEWYATKPWPIWQTAQGRRDAKSAREAIAGGLSEPRSVTSDARPRVTRRPPTHLPRQPESSLSPAAAAMTRTTFDARFAAYWQFLLKRFRDGETLIYSPRSVSPGVGNPRQIVEINTDGMRLREEGRGFFSTCDATELSEDFWNLSQDPLAASKSIKDLRQEHSIRNLVEFKRDMFDEFAVFGAREDPHG